ncbi:dienelactone hydrolase family protein [Prosthecobacter sp.]|uniref:dienelactone hydrolase family protein n=1 Tax=Prosthecobacter sp. TaxID=1965333 RepID=UPI003783B6F3
MKPSSTPLSAEVHKIVRIQGCSYALEGELQLPPGARGLVVFAHGSGSSRHSPRNRFAAQVMRGAGLGTLLLNLLTQAETEADVFTQDLSFDVEMLAGRLVAVAQWLHTQPETQGLPLGIFGASSGGGAALVAAARLGKKISAVVLRGGRPDLAGRALFHVEAPTLFIVGSQDDVVLDLNGNALDRMCCSEKELRVITGASHLFEEPGKLEQAAQISADWFCRHMAAAAGKGDTAP